MPINSLTVIPSNTAGNCPICDKLVPSNGYHVCGGVKVINLQKLVKLQVTQIEKLLNEWLETTDDSAAWWDGVRCSDRDMAKSYMFDGRVKTKSFLDWLKEKQIGDKQIL